MTRSPSFEVQSVALPIGLLVVAMCSIQLGAIFAKQLFPAVGAAGATALRLLLASLMLLAVKRPWRTRLRMREARVLILYGLSMGFMNFFFYSALNRIPLGIAVALEFTGPLAVAMATSRRPVDFVWIALAALGLLALLPVGHQTDALNASGVAFALAAGVCWALYIVFGQKAGRVHGEHTAALGTVAATVAILPLGLGHAGLALFSPALLPTAAVVAFLASALPYSLEIFALTRLPTRTFGVLMSAEPALGAVTGWLLLGETLTVSQWSAIACIMLASAGSAATSGTVTQALPD